MRRIKPAAVVGFGGYPTLPPLYAATRRKVPTLIHEQNAVMGRANKALAARVDAIAGGFLDPAGSKASATRSSSPAIRCGRPCSKPPRLPIAHPMPDEPFRLLVFGGSQGAQFFSEAMPAAIALLPRGAAQAAQVTQQARAEDVAQRQERLSRRLGVEAEVSPFFTDMAQRIAAAHLVISRSGASTVSEIAVIGRPALLVPYPLCARPRPGGQCGGACGGRRRPKCIRSRRCRRERLAELIGGLMDDPDAARRDGRAPRNRPAGRMPRGCSPT